MIRRITALLAMGLAIGLSVWLASARPAASHMPTGVETGSVTGSVTHSTIGFRSRTHLEEHYAKHGGEFGRLSIEGYLAMAQRLRDASPGGDVLEIVRPTDGVISRYDRASGAFLAADADGTIRTFFRPNDGEAYFRRQARRSPTP